MTTRQGVVKELIRVSDELHECWCDALTLRSGQEVFATIYPALDGYHVAGDIIADWYHHWVLVGCRRLLDDHADSRSLVRALRRLARIANQVTAEVVANAFGDTVVPNVGDTELSSARALLAHMNRGSQRSDRENVLDKALVDGAVLSLREKHEQLTKFTDRVVAHRDRRAHRAGVVTPAQIDELVSDVLNEVNRWYQFTAQTGLSNRAGPVRGAAALERALALFDWRELQDAAKGEWQRRQRDGEAPPRRDLRQSARVQFVWPDASE